MVQHDFDEIDDYKIRCTLSTTSHGVNLTLQTLSLPGIKKKYLKFQFETMALAVKFLKMFQKQIDYLNAEGILKAH